MIFNIILFCSYYKFNARNDHNNRIDEISIIHISR